MIYTVEDIKTDQAFAQRLMTLHASTKERLEQVVEIYSCLSAYINKEDVVIDIGCGFNPTALPFFTVRPKDYLAFDLSMATINMLKKYFACAGLPYSSEILDASGRTTVLQGDVVLLFKLFPRFPRNL